MFQAAASIERWRGGECVRALRCGSCRGMAGAEKPDRYHENRNLKSISSFCLQQCTSPAEASGDIVKGQRREWHQRGIDRQPIARHGPGQDVQHGVEQGKHQDQRQWRSQKVGYGIEARLVRLPIFWLTRPDCARSLRQYRAAFNQMPYTMSGTKTPAASTRPTALTGLVAALGRKSK